MIKRLSFFLLCLLLPFLLWAQSSPSLSSIDFSDARISQAGPESFYVRNVVLPDQTVSLIIALNEEGSWEISEVVSESKNIIPANVILDFATVEVKDDTNLEIDWVIYKGSILSGVLGFSGDDITVSTMFTTAGSVDSADEYPKALAELLDGNETGMSEADLASLREDYEAKIAKLTTDYNTLATERDTLKTEVDDAESENASLEEQIDTLKADKVSLQTLRDKLEADKTALQEMIDTLKSSATGGVTSDETVSASASLVQSYIDKLDKLQGEITALRTTVSSLETQLESEMLSAAAAVSKSLSADFDWAVANLSSAISDEIEAAAASLAASLPESSSGAVVVDAEELEAAAAKLARLFSANLDEAKAAILQSISKIEVPPPTVTGLSSGAGDPRIATLQAQIAKLTSRNAELTRKMTRLDEEIRSSLMKKGFIELIRPTLTRTLLSSFEPSEAQLGLWHVGDKSAKQIEKSMLFGKLLLPVTQDDKPVLYSFKSRSTDPDDEWVGLGLHIFVDNVEKRGYGLGDSLLVWLTRDQEVYKNDYTYLQLYRSDDDVHMDRVMDAVIQEPISSFLEIEVLYQPVLQYITISVDGEEKLRYKTWFGIDEGVQVALRSLGTAEFADLQVTTTP